jgi:hypothetical protein
MSENDEIELRDSEVALMDTLKTVFEILMSAGVKSEQIDKLLASQSQVYESPPSMSRAIYVVEKLREFVRNPERAKHQNK